MGPLAISIIDHIHHIIDTHIIWYMFASRDWHQILSFGVLARIAWMLLEPLLRKGSLIANLCDICAWVIMHVENTGTIFYKWDLCMRLATQISSALTDMEKKYESLATVLSEATVAPDQITLSQAESFLWIQNATHFMGICLPSSLS